VPEPVAKEPLRRSQLARSDYVPEVPLILPEPKKNRLKGLLRLVRPAIFLIIVALILFGAKAAHDWFDQNFAYGALKAGPYPHVYFIGTCDETTLPDGRKVQTRYKGKLPSFYQLPPVSTSKIGDMWYTEKDDSYWALEPVSTMSSMVG
jgi:hypothetical protein